MTTKKPTEPQVLRTAKRFLKDISPVLSTQEWFCIWESRWSELTPKNRQAIINVAEWHLKNGGK